jgi:hypothetical protein
MISVIVTTNVNDGHVSDRCSETGSNRYNRLGGRPVAGKGPELHSHNLHRLRYTFDAALVREIHRYDRQKNLAVRHRTAYEQHDNPGNVWGR